MPGTGRGPGGSRADPAEHAKRALADRIEDNLTRLLAKAEELLRENEAHVLGIAHALEVHKTLSGEDVTAIIEGQPGLVVDGTPYASRAFIQELRDYHRAAAHAHREHSRPQISLPVPPQLVTAGIAANGHGAANGTAAIGSAPNGSAANSGAPNSGAPGGDGVDRETLDDMYEPSDDIVSSGPDDDGGS
jgi:cell division protease FtsH